MYLTDAFVLILVDTEQNIFACGGVSLPSDIHQSIIYAYHRKYLNIVNVRKPFNFGNVRFMKS